MNMLSHDRGASLAKPSPLAGIPGSRPPHIEFDLAALTRREWWLWFSTVAVTLLSAGALLLTAFPRFFQHRDHFYELGAEQSRWAILCLVLVFNGWLVYRQRQFRRQRTISEPTQNAEQHAISTEVPGIDLATGLLNRAAAEQQLGKEISRAKRENTSLSLATLHVEDAPQLAKKHGQVALDQALKEFSRKLKEASRGSDYVVRLADDDFVLILPNCNLGEVKRVLDRVGAADVVIASGKKISLTYTTGWVDYQTGDVPSDLLKRATKLLHLYNSAADQSYSSSLAGK
jgi:diguanylate cyclase (GGDEF)-like protein